VLCSDGRRASSVPTQPPAEPVYEAELPGPNSALAGPTLRTAAAPAGVDTPISGDRTGDLWAQHPTTPCRTLTLRSGTRLYAADEPTTLPLLGIHE
jgi:hypothetical protein